MTVRMPAELMDSIRAAAWEAGRSMNSEIIWRLADSISLEAKT